MHARGPTRQRREDDDAHGNQRQTSRTRAGHSLHLFLLPRRYSLLFRSRIRRYPSTVAADHVSRLAGRQLPAGGLRPRVSG